MDLRQFTIQNVETLIRDRILSKRDYFGDLNNVDKISRAVSYGAENYFPQRSPVSGIYQMLSCDFYNCPPDTNYQCVRTFACAGDFTCEFDYSCNINKNFSCNPVTYEFNCLAQFTPRQGATGPLVISTANIHDITTSSAISGGNISGIFEGQVTQRGVCWGLTDPPTLDDSYTTEDLGFTSGYGDFISLITGLLDNTTYYVRAYAINQEIISFGETLQFLTVLQGPPFTGTNILICPYGKNIRDDILYTIVKRYYDQSFPNHPEILEQMINTMWRNYNDTFRDLLIVWLNVHYHFKHIED